jgi:plasmid stability protein
MERTTISLPDGLIRKLRIIAAERRVSMASIIREALEEKTARNRPKPKMGIFDSGRTDISQIASEGPVPPVSWR